MHKLLMTIGLALGMTLAAQQTPAAPQPSTVPSSWQLRFRYHDPQRVSLILPGEKEPVVYWFMRYTVENPTGAEVDFYPQFELVTDTLQVVRSDAKVSPAAFRAIQQRLGDPFLIPPEKVAGRLLRGKDRARHSVAIFPDFDPKARSFTIYVAGLSGEMKRIKNPVFNTNEPEGPDNQRYFTLRKTLAIPYKFPGSQTLHQSNQPQRVPDGQEWLMR